MTPARLAEVVRRERPRCVATLVRVLGDIELAEDAFQDAVEAALRTWPRDGPPDNPGAWLTTTARNRAVDVLRRASTAARLAGRLGAVASDRPRLPDPSDAEELAPVDDDELALLFACCHPALAHEARVGLTLRVLGGLSTAQVARVLLVGERAMAQRIVRARRKIRDAAVPLVVPTSEELPGRLRSVLAVVYLVHTAGNDTQDGEELRTEAHRLARLLHRLLPDEPEVTGLLALVVLGEARAPARRDGAGRFVPLRDQDRTRWDRAAIAEGHALVRACLQRDEPGPYQLQAAINAVHTDARRWADTDWRQVVALYDQLLAHQPTPVVALNRAIALGELEGPDAALVLVDALDLDDRYQPLHATRADLLRRLGRRDEARSAYARAAELTTDTAVADHLRRTAAGLV